MGGLIRSVLAFSGHWVVGLTSKFYSANINVNQSESQLGRFLKARVSFGKIRRGEPYLLGY